MDFDEAVDFLTGLDKSREELQLAPTRDLLDALGRPQDDFDVVQVGGTNGKGSTATMIQRVLREGGHDTGLFTSPHLTDLRERVRVNGRVVRKRRVVEFVERLRDHVRDDDVTPPSFFEATTVLALWTFAEQEVDIAVLEVGIGGRYDATSAVEPTVSALTTVGIEHADLLGETRTEIARDQAQIGPVDGTLVTGADDEILPSIREAAQQSQVRTIRPARDCEPTGETAATYRYHGKEETGDRVTVETGEGEVTARLSLSGSHQAQNAAVATAVAAEMGVRSPETVASGLALTTVPGRFEVMDREPLTVLDGAHNPHACRAVADTLSRFDYDRLHVVFGAVTEKDHEEMIDALPPADHAVTCAPSTPRAADEETLAAAFAEQPGVNAESAGSIEEAVERAIQSAAESDCVLVTGSLYVVGDARNVWTCRVVPKTPPSRSASATVEAQPTFETVETRLSAPHTDVVLTEADAVGAHCSTSANDSVTYTDVTVTGTHDQFEEIITRLGSRSPEFDYLCEQLSAAVFETGGPPEWVPWSGETAIMGILNVTPDSFHDGGEYVDVADAVERATEMVERGASIVDVGGEATNPDVDATATEVEIDRVVPVVEEIADLDAAISVDTRKSAVAEAALRAGADIVNDVSGFEDPDLPRVAADYDAPLVAMHSGSVPVDRSSRLAYDDVVSDVIHELEATVRRAQRAGVDPEKIIVDPGVGFGKSTTESFEIVSRLHEFDAFDGPLMLGHSRKSMFDHVDSYPDEGAYATVSETALAVQQGVDIVRVHDVRENAVAARTASESSR